MNILSEIVVNEVSKSIYGVPIINSVSMTLVSGNVYGFQGINGSGKTMLLRAVAGLIVPTEGSVSVFGKQLNEKYAFPENMGLIIENVGFWPDFTGMKNLQLLASVRKKIGDEEIRKTIRRVGLDPVDRRVYKKYSLGMKQRLGLAQAVMEEPELLLLDEPTNGLDDSGIEQFNTIIREEHSRGATILLASHDKEELKLLCGRTFRISDGVVAEEELP